MTCPPYQRANVNCYRQLILCLLEGTLQQDELGLTIGGVKVAAALQRECQLSETGLPVFGRTLLQPPKAGMARSHIPPGLNRGPVAGSRRLSRFENWRVFVSASLNLCKSKDSLSLGESFLLLRVPSSLRCSS